MRIKHHTTRAPFDSLRRWWVKSDQWHRRSQNMLWTLNCSADMKFEPAPYLYTAGVYSSTVQCMFLYSDSLYIGRLPVRRTTSNAPVFVHRVFLRNFFPRCVSVGTKCTDREIASAASVFKGRSAPDFWIVTNVAPSINLTAYLLLCYHVDRLQNCHSRCRSNLTDHDAHCTAVCLLDTGQQHDHVGSLDVSDDW